MLEKACQLFLLAVFSCTIWHRLKCINTETFIECYIFFIFQASLDLQSGIYAFVTYVFSYKVIKI